MFASTNQSMIAQDVSDINHGSAAVTTAALGLGQLVPAHALTGGVPGTMSENRVTPSRTQPPLAARVTRAATGSLGTTGIEYAMSPGRPRHVAGVPRAVAQSPVASELGQETPAMLSDDSLTLSPELPVSRRLGLGTLKRDNRARLGSGKRIAVSA